MNAAPSLIPHLDPDASWTIQQEAGDRLGKIYTAGARDRQAAAIGEQNVHLGRRVVKVTHEASGKRVYVVGVDFDNVLCRALIIHRAMARAFPENRRHHIENALRVRDALCWWGLDPSMRGT